MPHPRPSFSRKERVRRFELHGGKCHICGVKIQPGEKWELEHVVEWELTQDNSDDNVKPAHAACHKPKTARFKKDLSRMDRARARHIGAMPKGKGWNTTHKKKLDGTAVKR